jgi:hypothetical protein
MIGDNGLFLDDWVRADLEKRLQKPVFGGGDSVRDFFELIFSRQASPLRSRGKLVRPLART